ncbi:SDR family oxidoreductase [Dankookia rubra]|uniref:SDR family oxidoreductase n=1 Tax=Dankookia rubra TaxID=1442381 RepID=A0A4R5Q7C6_9PROT|nr:SDR family oxidoreductase [Dankookia rubra]TDH58596.1 SDR family oxidoreductase [Dankookia rubra]
MRIVVIGGTGRIGAQVVDRLRRQGQEVLAASPSGGVDSVTGAGLPAALAGARVVVDLSNAPSFEDRAAMEFFQASTRNLLAAGAAAGIGHHLALSVVGTDRLQENGYFRAKLAQERLIAAGPLPWTILRATQFLEFLDGIIEGGAGPGGIRLPAALFQPIAAADVAALVAEAALQPPVNRMIEIAGPERIGMAALAGRYLAARGDARRVAADPAARYFGAAIDDRSLTAGEDARLGPTRIADWLRATAPAPAPQR